jgi:hypothetical protein
MKLNNPRQKEIYDLIINDIDTNGKFYSTISNREISLKLNMPQNTVRDMICKLNKSNHLINLINHWEGKTFYSRKVLKGNVQG